MSKPTQAPIPLNATDAQEWATRFAFVSDPTRLRLLTHMHLHPGCTVTELAEAAGTSPATTSQSLKGMRARGWVHTTRAGRQVNYSISDEITHRILHFMGQSHDNDHECDPSGHHRS